MAVARILAEWLSRSLGQRVIVENRPGMGGNLGAQSVIKAPPDGHTLLFMGPNNAIATSLYKRLPFDFLRGTEAVGGVMRLTNLMVVPPSLPVKTVQEFIDYAKANPGKLSMASTGVGTSVHLSGELFKAMTKTDLVHVPYRGSSPAYPDLITGKVHVLFGNLTGSIELVQAGRLRGLGGHVREAVGRPCRTCRPSPRPCRATRPTSGTASSLRRARRRRSLPRSTRRSTPGSPTPTCAPVSSRPAACRCR